MTELNVQTETSYEDTFIAFVEISQDDTNRMLSERTYEDELLETTESKSMSYESGEVYVPKGCTLDLEVITPEPHISVEVSRNEYKKGEAEYGYWQFGDTSMFENWVDANNIKLHKK